MGRKRKYLTQEERLQARRESARKSYHKKKSEKLIDDEFNRLLAMNPDLYTTKKKLNPDQKSFIASLMNLPLDVKPLINRKTRQTNSFAKQ